MKTILAVISFSILVGCESRHKIIEGNSAPLPSLAIHIGESGIINGIECDGDLRLAPPGAFAYEKDGDALIITGTKNVIALVYCEDKPVAGVAVYKPGFPLDGK